MNTKSDQIEAPIGLESKEQALTKTKQHAAGSDLLTLSVWTPWRARQMRCAGGAPVRAA